MPPQERTPKLKTEIETSLGSAEKIIGNEPEHALVPPDRSREAILDMPVDQIKSAFGRRYQMYVDLLRQQRSKEKRGADYLSDEDAAHMRKWLVALNSLDHYIKDHHAGKEQTLRPRQVTVFEDLRDFVEKGSNGGFIKLPTGTGKTVLFTELIEAMNLKTLIVVPTQLLIQQTKEAIETFASDLDVGRIYSKAKEHGRQVTITTYDSLVSQVKSGKLKSEDYDCVILDEAHRSLSDARIKTVQQFPHALRIGFTATPEYSFKKKVSNLLPVEIHRMSFKEAVEEALLSPFSAFVARTNTDLSHVKINQSDEYDEEGLAKAVNIASRNQAAVELYQRMFAGQTSVVFCVGIAHARAVAELFKKAGILAAHISGEMTDTMQQELLNRFQNGTIKVLCNADLLIAGFDEPKASMCLNLRPTRSRVVAEQRGGRVLRLDEGNPEKHASVVDFLDEGETEGPPPVLFADVAEGAEFGPEEEKRPGGGRGGGRRPIPILDIPGLQVITDVEEVMRVVGELREREKLSQKEFLPLPFAELQIEVRKAKIQTRRHYTNEYKNHPGWPSAPHVIYKDQWPGWRKFLIREHLAPDELRDFRKGAKFWQEMFLFEDLQKMVKAKGVKNSTEYSNMYKNEGWPSTPYQTYANQWEGWDKFLGNIEYPTFKNLRDEVQKNGIRSSLHYHRIYKDHSDWPFAPNSVYKKEWEGWDKFLGKK